MNDDEIIDVSPPKRRRWRRWVILAIVVVLFLFSRSISIYLSAAWFGSLGFSHVYWYVFKFKIGLFLVFAILTIGLLRLAFWLFERTFATGALEKRTIIVNNQPVEFSPGRFIRPLGWIIAALVGLFYGLTMKNHWQSFALFFNRSSATSPDPIFNKPLSYYLFSLPVYDLISAWLIVLAFIVLVAALAYSLLLVPQKESKSSAFLATPRSFASVSIALALFLLLLAWRTYLSRFPYLWTDHASFSGVTYTEANYVLPALFLVSIALLVAAVVCVINAFTKRGLRMILLGLALPVLIYVVGVFLVPAYVQSFVVKPNELGRESPFIEHNIAWTRRGFGLDQIELRQFEADTSIEAFDLSANRPTIDNIRLWDWRALQDTLRQIQAIRTYYDFVDVDVDRYQVDGTTRQMMIAARELDLNKLPESSRNWVNEKLIYTHGYGITMNTANGFTPEGMPRFVVSNMPIESKSQDIKVTRPEIYFGQDTDSDIYLKTNQNEFDYPQGESNNYTTYQGTGGIQIGGRLHRWILAWALGDLSKLPFSDDVTPNSRVLIHRNIREIVNGIAPFLIYDNDPYIVVNNEGRLFWMIDAFTESANYPYSSHHRVGSNTINYIRNSVKVVIDAYNGSVSFYVFDNQDPLISAYRSVFPGLFQDADQMPADLRSHVRYPETLIKVQGEVYGLYHTQNPKVFFQREDVWSVANRISSDDQNNKKFQPIDPYFVLMQLPGEQTQNEFVLILPFTPSNRNNMIGWMAGRSDGENYGKLLAYNFPASRLVDGPLQIEARIDQNSQLSSQFTLWSQQGSRVLRGHLLVIPIGRALLYVEPIYLKAESSPMPELRLVVLATQDRLAFGPNFDEALRSLFGESATATAPPREGQPPGPQPATSPSPGTTQGPVAVPTPSDDLRVLVNRAIQEFEDYQRLTAEGKLAEAGQKLEQHKRTLEEIRRLTSRR